MDNKININNKLIANVEFYTYRSGRKGFRLVTENGETLMYCTICLDNVKVKENEVIIKNYNENKGIYGALLKAKFITPYHRKVVIGYNHGLVCMLNLNYKYKKLV